MAFVHTRRIVIFKHCLAFFLILFFISSSTALAIAPPPITVNNTTNTYYPNKFFNVTDGKITKQIYAGDTLVGTVETDGSTVTPYYVNTDDVLGSNVVSDQAGNPVETLDYYPYGDMRLDEKASSFNEQNKFGGHVYDPATDLNYFGARYYNSKTGKFTSEDPMFWTLPKSYLADPQQQNSYSYARDNPIIWGDSNGLIPYVIAGFARPGIPRNTANDPDIRQVMSWATTQLGSPAEFYAWSQNDNERAFNTAAQGLAAKIIAEHKNGEPVDLIAHSDGGRVAEKAAEVLIKNGITPRNIVMGGTPIVGDDFNVNNAQNTVLAYNTEDPVQNKGGNLLVGSAFIGAGLGMIACGPLCGLIGSIEGVNLDKGEAGPAERTIPGAKNIDVTGFINEEQKTTGEKGLLFEHSATLFSSAAQHQIESRLLK